MSGLSGLALYVPQPRVQLEAWSEWAGQPAPKMKAVVGDAFRVAASHEDAYTMAAQAVLRLLGQYDLDPASVGLLILATESSTDNAVGGPTVKGLVDMELRARGQTPLSRRLETFEMKQACLSGVNGLLAAVRFVDAEPESKAIVVASDIAEYERASTGEPTQGAGAVAMLVEKKAALLEFDLSRVGRSAADRVFDFRKPMRGAQAAPSSKFRPQDFPAFAGPYSTHCYLESVEEAFLHLAERVGEAPAVLLDRAAVILSHRPYEKMPQTSLARLFLRRKIEQGRDAAAVFCRELNVEISKLEEQLEERPDLPKLCQDPELDPAPELNRVLRALSKSAEFRDFLRQKTDFGTDVVRQLGNLYTASLPAWIGAALEGAAQAELDFLSDRILLLGYGSGDTSLAIEAQLVDGWQAAATRCRFNDALEGASDISQSDYEAAHDRRVGIVRSVGLGLVRVGDGSRGFDDRGIPYYGRLG